MTDRKAGPPAKVPVFYFVPPSEIDDALERTEQAGCLPARAIVIGNEAALLKALESQWGRSLDLTIVLSAKDGDAAREGTVLILEHEQISLAEAMWIGGTATAPKGPIEQIDTDGRPVAEWAKDLIRLV